MRVLLLALALLMAGGQMALAASIPTNSTNMSFDGGHGTQVEYVGSNGRTFLWYPGNKVVLPGRWKVQGKSVCFIYGPNTYNPVTGVVGAKWECEPIAVYTGVQTGRAAGDVFGLAKRAAVPFILRRDKTTIAALAGRARLR